MTINMVRLLRDSRFAAYATTLVTLVCSACAPTHYVNNGTYLPADFSSINAKDARLFLRVADNEIVQFKGTATFDSIDAKHPAMMYGPGAAAAIIQLATQSTVVEISKGSQKQRLQSEADTVLEPYQTVLSGYHYDTLVVTALEKFAKSASSFTIGKTTQRPDANWYIETTPVFSIAQDQNAIILENTISIYAPGSTQTPQFQNIVKVVSSPIHTAEPTQFWTEDAGRQLKETASTLFSDSLSIFLGQANEAYSDPNTPYRTFRYLEGTNEKIERAQLVASSCDRLVVRTLRGYLLSFPATQNSAKPHDNSHCAEKANS